MPKKKKEQDAQEEQEVQKVVQKIEDDDDENGGSSRKLQDNGVGHGPYSKLLAGCKRAILEYKVCGNLTSACLAYAKPNGSVRLYLYDKETIKKLEEDMGMKVDFQMIEKKIAEYGYLVRPVNYVEEGRASEPLPSGKKITKKQEAINKKKDKIKKKVDGLEDKLSKIKNQKCDRANKLKEKIKELTTRMDRL
jgi:hypothetical protein